jgi:REP element-mobilizing transposase RayT
VLEEGFFDPRKPFWVRWGDLPHWRQEGALYFVTFRLSDSLPQSKLQQWRNARDDWRDANPNATHTQLVQFSMMQRRRIEHWLDQGYGSCVLRSPMARQIVEDAIRHFADKRYELGPYTVAPNHVHVILRTALGIDLSQVLHSWKRHTSSALRRLTEVAAHFPRGERSLWQAESFDHIVRNSLSLERFSNYIMDHDRRRPVAGPD